MALASSAMIYWVKSVRIWSFSGPYFPAFQLNTERWRVSLPIESECGKIWTRETPNTDTFHAVLLELQPWAKYLRQTLDFIQNSAIPTVATAKVQYLIFSLLFFSLKDKIFILEGRLGTRL